MFRNKRVSGSRKTWQSSCEAIWFGAKNAHTSPTEREKENWEINNLYNTEFYQVKMT